MLIIEIVLALAALYAGGLWTWYLVQFVRVLRSDQIPIDVEVETFHLGLCFILAVGFLGLLLK